MTKRPYLVEDRYRRHRDGCSALGGAQVTWVPKCDSPWDAIELAIPQELQAGRNYLKQEVCAYLDGEQRLPLEYNGLTLPENLHRGTWVQVVLHDQGSAMGKMHGYSFESVDL